MDLWGTQVSTFRLFFLIPPDVSPASPRQGLIYVTHKMFHWWLFYLRGQGLEIFAGYNWRNLTGQPCRHIFCAWDNHAKKYLLQNVIRTLTVSGGGALIPSWPAITQCPKEKLVHHGHWHGSRQKLKEGGSWHSAGILFRLGPQSMEWRHPRQGWVFTSHLTLSGCSFTGTITDLRSGWADSTD